MYDINIVSKEEIKFFVKRSEKDAVLEEGELIGYVASPTKYFTVEGAHLYIKMLKDGVVVDPLDYLNY